MRKRRRPTAESPDAPPDARTAPDALGEVPPAPAVGGNAMAPRPRQGNGLPGHGGSGAVGQQRRGGRPVPAANGGGLTAPGAFVVGGGVTLLGGLLDRGFGGSVGAVFGTVFLGACVLVAVKTRIRDLTAAVFAPPIAFAMTMLVLSVVFPSDNAESFAVRTGLDMFTALTFKAGLLWGGTALAGAIVLVRHRADRDLARRRAAREARPAREAREAREPYEVREPREH